MHFLGSFLAKESIMLISIKEDLRKDMFQSEILDNLSTGVIAVDNELKVIWVNSACESLLHISRERSTNTKVSQVLIVTDDLSRILKQVRDLALPIAKRGVSLRLPSGSSLQADLIITPLIVQEDVSELLVEILPVDRYLQISHEESLLTAQETSRTMIKGLAHEIKNPLGGVRGAAQLLARELSDPNLCEYTNIIIEEADRLRDLVDRLFGPRQKPSFNQINIHQILEHVVKLTNAEHSVDSLFKRDYDPSIPEFLADQAQLTQAILNIVQNAIQASNDISECNIQLRTRPTRQITIGGIRHKLLCLIDIIDNGPGIGNELLPSIFMPMVTGRADGTGLGLSISQSIVKQHGGLIECKSNPGNTCFTLTLPMEPSNE